MTAGPNAALEAERTARPNSIEIREAMAAEYESAGRYEEAAGVYRELLALYPATAALFVNRIRLGAAAMWLSSGLVLLSGLLMPTSGGPEVFRLPVYRAAIVLLLAALPLFSTAAISTYKLLSYGPDHRPAFWAMVLTVCGAALAMPALGIRAVVYPLVVGGDVFDTLEGYGWLGIGVWILVLGVGLMSWVAWRDAHFSSRAVLVHLAGWILLAAGGFEPAGLLSLFWGALVFVGGWHLGRTLWTRAPLQFSPEAAP